MYLTPIGAIRSRQLQLPAADPHVLQASSFLGEQILPTRMAQFAIERGFRTDNNGTAWGFFARAASTYDLICKQTRRLDEVREALINGALVIASVRNGHFTGAGHYILLVGINGDWIDVFDPNPDNRSYGSDGLIRIGIKNDGKVSANVAVFQKEAAQYWIFTKPIKELQVPLPQTLSQTTREPGCSWFWPPAIFSVLQRPRATHQMPLFLPLSSEYLKIHDPTGTNDFWRSLAVSLRVQCKGR